MVDSHRYHRLGGTVLVWKPYLRWSSTKVTATPQEIERGRYLTLAGDCAACHTSADGAPLAGGFPLDTPFGTIYSSNLTPSADFGIGRWTKDDFYKALTQGISPPSKNLYPAMPYTSYKGSLGRILTLFTVIWWASQLLMSRHLKIHCHSHWTNAWQWLAGIYCF